MPKRALFDDWPERYDLWFTTPIGRLVRRVEGDLVIRMLAPGPGERVLDAGCGTGVFTTDIAAAGASVVGLDISRPMLQRAKDKMAGQHFAPVEGDMRRLPFQDSSFDAAVSVTALEFISDGRSAVDELFRVTRPGGVVVVATLNSLSPWAERRRAKTGRGQRHVLEHAHYRSPTELLALSHLAGTTGTAVYFQNDDEPDRAMDIERSGRLLDLDTGAFVAVRWHKPRR